MFKEKKIILNSHEGIWKKKKVVMNFEFKLCDEQTTNLWSKKYYKFRMSWQFWRRIKWPFKSNRSAIFRHVRIDWFIPNWLSNQFSQLSVSIKMERETVSRRNRIHKMNSLNIISSQSIRHKVSIKAVNKSKHLQWNYGLINLRHLISKSLVKSYAIISGQCPQ